MGVVKIPIDLDTKDAVKTAESLGKEVDRAVNKKSPTRSIATATTLQQLKASTQAADKLVTKIQKLSETKIPTEQYIQQKEILEATDKEINQLSKDQAKLASQVVPTEQYKALESSLESAYTSYEKLIKQGEKADVLGIVEYWSNLQENIINTTTDLENMKAQMAALEEEYNKPATSPKLEQLKADYAKVQQEMAAAQKEHGTTSPEYVDAYVKAVTLQKEIAVESKAAAQEQFLLKKQMEALQVTIDDTEQSLASMYGEADANAESLEFIYEWSQNIVEVGDQIDALEAEIAHLKLMGEDTTVIDPERLEMVTQKLEELKKNAAETEAILQQMESSGESHIWGSQTEEAAQLEKELDVVNDRTKVYLARLNQIPLRELLPPVQKALNGLDRAFGKLLSLVIRFGKKTLSVFGSLAGKVRDFAGGLLSAFKTTHPHIDKTNKSFGATLKNILGLTLGVASLSAIFGKLKDAFKYGFGNLVGANIHNLKTQIQDLHASLAMLKNGFAAAFEPIIQQIIPYIQQLVAWIGTLIDKLAQLIAALSGKGTYIKALKKNIDAAANSAKKALAPFDELNVLTKPKGAGDYSGLFTEAEVSSPMKDLAEKIKDIAKKLFNPIKKAWDAVGEYVIESWKYAWDQAKGFAHDFLRDFIKMWDSEATEKIFESIFRIIGGIGLIVGNLIKQFRKAWNENARGYKILCAIRDIFGIIVSWIEKAVDATVKWVATLDFSPLMEQIWRFLEAVKPAVDALSGVLYDFYTTVLLPLAQWTLESGLPQLVQVFRDFVNKVDWQKLRSNLADLWAHLEPFAEKVGQGLIDFLGYLTQKLADFINSEKFEKFLKWLGEWLDSIDFEAIGKEIGKLVQWFKDLLNKIDWDLLSERMSKFWEHLKPFAEKVGQGLLDFIEDLAQKLADWVNSEDFEKFLEKVEKWMDDFEPEDVGKAAENILKVVAALAALKGALAALKGVASTVDILSKLGLIGGGGKAVAGLGKAASGASAASAASTGASAAAGGGAIAAALASMGGFGGMMTMDLGVIMGAGTATEIGLTFGTGILGGIAAAFAGGAVAKLIDNNIIAPFLEGMGSDLARYYENFNWFGDNEYGFFKAVKDEMGFFLEDTGKSFGAFGDLVSGDADRVVKGIKDMSDESNQFFDLCMHSTPLAGAVWDSFGKDAMNSLDSVGDSTKETSGALSSFIDFCLIGVPSAKDTLDEFKTNAVNDLDSAGNSATVASDNFNKFLDVCFIGVPAARDLWHEYSSSTVEDLNTSVDAINGASEATVSFKDVVSSAATSILNKFSSIASGISSKVKEIAKAMDEDFGISDAWNNLKSAARFRNSGSVKGVSHLATGAVIPPNQEFLAVLGDQRRGTNVEAPLSTIQDALVGALQQVGFAGGGGGDGQPINIYLGSELIYSEMQKMERRNAVIGG